MSITLIVLAIVLSVVICLLILIQNPKGGGLSSGFSGSNVMGVQRTGDFLEKGTWALAIAIMVISLLVNVIIPRSGEVQKSNEIQNQINKTTAPASAAPTLPLSTPIGDTTKK